MGLRSDQLQLFESLAAYTRQLVDASQEKWREFEGKPVPVIDPKKYTLRQAQRIAQEAGYERFWWKPCPHGHDCPRYTSIGKCVLCKAEINARPENKERVKECNKRRRARPEVKERIKVYNAKYKSQPEVKERRKERVKERYENDAWFAETLRLRKLFRPFKNRARNYLMNPDLVDYSHEKHPIFGCSVHELAQHFLRELKGRDPSLIGGRRPDSLHVDHVRPVSSFDFLDPEQAKCCMNWRNTQLLGCIENIEKSDRYDEQDEPPWAQRMISLGWDGDLYLKYR